MNKQSSFWFKYLNFLEDLPSTSVIDNFFKFDFSFMEQFQNSDGENGGVGHTWYLPNYMVVLNFVEDLLSTSVIANISKFDDVSFMTQF